jgi:hypothetical protein
VTGFAEKHWKRNMKRSLFILFALLAAGNSLGGETKTIWEGNVHLGDNPDQFSNSATAGLAIQVPCKLGFETKGKLTITTRDVQTLAGEGHYAELVAHYEDGDAPAREYVVETLRIKGDATNVDIDHTFDFDPSRGLQGTSPAYYSVKVKIDTGVRYSLWDDFLLKRIVVEQ